MEDSILSIKSLIKGFVRRIKNIKGLDENEQYWIIKDLIMDVPKGKITALIGGNGTGKTTLFNIVSGFVKADSGTITYNANGIKENLLDKAPHKITRLGIGRMFQDNHIFPDMSVMDNMLIAAANHEGEIPFVALIKNRAVKNEEKKQAQKVETVFDNLFGANNPFWEQRNIPAGNLSYGQQRLLGLARLFMRNYPLLLLDEPTAGVNPEIIEQIKKLIVTFKENGQSVLLIEHNLEVVKDIADYCCYLEAGHIVLSGTPEEVINNKEVKKTYLGLS